MQKQKRRTGHLKKLNITRTGRLVSLRLKGAVHGRKGRSED